MHVGETKGWVQLLGPDLLHPPFQSQSGVGRGEGSSGRERMAVQGEAGVAGSRIQLSCRSQWTGMTQGAAEAFSSAHPSPDAIRTGHLILVIFPFGAC